MIIPVGSIIIGLTGALALELYLGCSKMELFKNYSRAYLILFFLYLLSLFASPEKGHAFCDNCRRMTLRDQDYFAADHTHYGEYAEIAYNHFKKIEADHQYGLEDLYIATLSAAMTACVLDDPRAIAVTIALTSASTYFNACYSCHRACRDQVNLYRYYLFYCNASAQQLVEGHVWCTNCYRLYKLYHYNGEIELPPAYCKSSYGCPHKKE